jgi:hypothetical protein
MTYDNQKELLAITQKVFELMAYIQTLEFTVGEMQVTMKMKNVRVGADKNV